MRFWLVISIIVAILLGTLIAIGVHIYRPDRPEPAVAATQVTAPAPEAKPTTRSTPVARIQAYSDLLRTLPGMADVAIGEEKLALDQAARIHLPYWAYVCPRRDLWIAHPDAPPLSSANDEGTRAVHVTREEVVFVHWYRTGRTYRPLPVYRDEGGRFRVFRKSAEPVKLVRTDYQWAYAVSIGDLFAVPTERGVAVVRTTGEITEEYRELSSRPGGIPAIEPTQHGFLTWIPTARGEAAKAAWFSNNAWQELPESWVQPFLHLVPFTDGSVLQIISKSPGKVTLQIAALETTPPETAEVTRLVSELADEDPAVRDGAHSQLAAMGPAAWDLLTASLGEAQGEARLRLEELIRARKEPSLGRFQLIDGDLRPVWRVRDGVIYLAGNGVRVVSGGGDEEITPAWIAIRRGRPIELLGPTLARNLAVGAVDLYCVGNEWVVSDESGGAQLFFGQELLPLTKERDIGYRRLAGIDRQTRVLLTRTDAKEDGRDFLLIDAWVADPTPLLQIWTMSAEGGEAGWSDDGWPAVQRGGAFTLKQDGWGQLKGELQTTSAAPATQPSAAGTMRQVAALADGSSIWISDVMMELQTADGRKLEQSRPAEMAGEVLGGAVIGDRLYLVHSGSAISRLRLNQAGDRPFALEAVFTENVPYTAEVGRVWADPAGRICITTPDAKLIVIFPQRKIAPSIMDLIPENELQQARPATGPE